MRFRTIGLISTLALGLLAGPLPAEAQKAGKVYRIGWLRFSPRPPTGPTHVAFRQGFCRIREDNHMPIITICRGAFAGGEEVAQYVAQTLDFRCVGREELVEASRTYRITAAKLNEILEREPHWWEHWHQNLQPYRIALQAAMCSVAQEGNIVYHGHVGHELLPGIRHVLKVLLTAPLEFRIKKVRSQQRLDETSARRYIDHVDRARTRRLTAMFGSDWRDPTRYDLVLNLAQMSLETARHIIVEVARLGQYQPTAASEQELQNLALTTRVQAALMMSPRYRNIALNVQAEGGQVRVSGVVTRSVSQHEIIRHVECVPGVSNVVMDLIRLPDHPKYWCF